MAGGWHPEDPTPHDAFRHVPFGLADRVVPRGAPFDFDEWRQASREALPSPELAPPASAVYSGDQWEAVMAGDFFQVPLVSVKSLTHLGTGPARLLPWSSCSLATLTVQAALTLPCPLRR